MALVLLTLCNGAAANAQVLQITPGSIALAAGGTAVCPVPTDCPALTGADLGSTTDVKVDVGGNVYIVDYNKNVVRRVDVDTQRITTLVGGGTGCPGETDAIGDGCPAASAVLNGPYALAIDANGNGYVTEGGVVGNITPRVRIVNGANGLISIFAGTGVAGYTGDGGPATNATLEEPTGVVADANGNVYIVDLLANVVRKVDLNFKITTVVGGGTGCSGQTDSVGDGCLATSASLNNPYGITVDAAGNLYIADTNNNRIREVNATTNIITTIAGTGTTGFSGDNGPATSATLSSPERVVIDAAGNLYISDTGSRVRKIDTTGTITTVVGGGPGCSFTPCSALETSGTDGSGYLVGVGVDQLGSLYPGSTDEVQKVGPQGAVAFPETLVAQSSAAQTIMLSNVAPVGADPDTLPTTLAGYVLTGNTADFSLTGGTCITNNSLAVGASCTLQATFTPTVAGERSATVTFSDTTEAETHTITLYGLANVLLAQTITFPTSNHTYGDGPFTLAAEASSGLPVTYSLVSGPATLSGSTLSITGAGTVTVEANQAGNGTYLPAAAVQQTFTIAKAGLLVEATPLSRYTDQINPPALTYSIFGFVLGDTQASATTGQPALSTTAVPPHPPEGAYVITITAGTLAAANYSFSFENQFLDISPPTATQTSLALSTATATTQQVVTLTATVSTEETLVPGIVTFLDGTTVVGTAQLIGEEGGEGFNPGTAVLKRSFPPGTHSLVAQYTGLPGFTASSSTQQSLTVTGTLPSTTTLTVQSNSTNPANSDFTATVLGLGPQQPTGTVNFNDVTAGAVLGSVTPSAPSSSFQMQQFSSGSATGQIAMGDLNGDGIQDMVVTDHGNIDVLLGNADGTYAAPVAYAAGTNLQFVALGDINADGMLDVVVGDYSSGSIVVLLGNGDGTLRDPETYALPAPSDPYGIVLADVNQDGLPDIVVAQNNGQNLVTVLLNNGDDGFQSPQSFGTGGSQGITVGDFNGDGMPDIAASTGSNVAVLLGNGDGTFQPQQNSPASGVGITSGDFNGDGKLDVALANSASVVVALGNGNGTFGSPVSYPVSTSAASIATADFNQDGHLDLVASNTSTGASGTSVLLGVGDGTFQTPQVYKAGGALGGISVGDINGDDMPDIVTLDPLNGEISVLLGGMLDTASLTNVVVLGTGQHLIDASYAPGATSIYPASVSNTVTVNAQPLTITSISPQEIAAGANGLTLVVNGSNFVAGTVVLANGVAVSTSYINAAQLNATLPAKLLTTTGTIQIQASIQLYTAEDSITSNALPLTVVPDVVLTSLTPSLAIAQSTATPITASGSNFTPTTVLQFNGVSLATTVVSATQLQAVIPAASLATAMTAQVTAVDPASGSQSAAVPFTILPSPAVVFSGPPTANPATQPGLTFQLSQPYPIDLAGTMTLTFQPDQGEPDDPSIQFASGGRTFTFTLPANTSTTPAIQLQAGTVAGTITVTLTLTASGVDVTPPNTAPVIINIPKGVPVITQQSIIRSGTSVTIYVTGYSSSRDMANAYFDFTPVAGTRFSQSSFTVPVGTLFSGWFGSTASNQYGSTFTYFQTFTLNNSAADVGSVTITLENAQGNSQIEVAQ